MVERIVTVTMQGVIRLTAPAPNDLIALDVEGCLHDMIMRAQQGLGFQHPLLEGAQLEILEFDVKVGLTVPGVAQ